MHTLLQGFAKNHFHLGGSFGPRKSSGLCFAPQRQLVPPWSGEQIDQALGNGGFIEMIHHDHRVTTDFGKLGDARDKRRSSAGHRFQHREAKPLVKRWHSQKPCSRIQLSELDVGNVAS